MLIGNTLPCSLLALTYDLWDSTFIRCRMANPSTKFGNPATVHVRGISVLIWPSESREPYYAWRETTIHSELTTLICLFYSLHNSGAPMTGLHMETGLVLTLGIVDHLVRHTPFGMNLGQRSRLINGLSDCRCFSLLPSGCHGNLTVLNLLSVSVAKNQHFRPCRKNYAFDRKTIDTF